MSRRVRAAAACLGRAGFPGDLSMSSSDWVEFLERHSKITALGSAATIVVVGLGAFSLLPQSHLSAPAPEPVRMVGAQQIDTHASPPRMLESGAPFSFA